MHRVGTVTERALGKPLRARVDERKDLGLSRAGATLDHGSMPHA